MANADSKNVHRTIKWLKKANADWTLCFSIIVEKIGMKAEDKAPSPKSRRNKLGIVNQFGDLGDSDDCGGFARFGDLDKFL